MPKKQAREQGRQATETLDNVPVEEPLLVCEDPLLTDLEVVSGAVGGIGNLWWTVVSPNVFAIVKARTKPDNSGTWASIAWDGVGQPGDRGNLKEVSRATATADGAYREVGAQLNSPRMFERVEVYNLLPLDCDLPIHVGGTVWKGYAGHVAGNIATVEATTEPHSNRVWSKLGWAPGGAAGNPNQRRYNVTAAGDQVIDVTLGTPAIGVITRQATLHICDWPRLDVAWEQFDTLAVLNDGVAEIDKPFDKRWEKGRQHAVPGMAAKKATDKVQAPLCYAAGATIKVKAGFKVTRKPTDDETVKIEGRATVGGVAMVWKATVPVGKADTDVQFAEVAADQPLAASKVGCEDAFKIDWFMRDADDATWIASGSSTHLLYVTLAAPQAALYWTLLDISCRNAKDTTTEDAFVDAAFAPFRAQTGDARGFKRMGDQVKLTYYGLGAKTAQGTVVQTPRGILSSANGAGRCGGWARLLIHLFALHGVAGSPKVRGIILDCSADGTGQMLLIVRNTVFNGAGTSTAAPYTHKHGECTKQNGLPGQGKTNPQFVFSDHIAVYYDSKIYDPSYGVGPQPSIVQYELDAMAGVGTMVNGMTGFNQADGTAQFMPDDCCEGFFRETMPAGKTLDDVALPFGKTGNDIWNHALNRATKALGINPPAAGTALYVPRAWAPARLMLTQKFS